MAKFTLPELPYDYNALEPYIDEETLHVHHDKHHQAYTDKFNAALEAAGVESDDIQEIFSNVSKYGNAVRNNGGGYYNHIFYWESMAPAGSTELSGDLKEAIDRDFGSYENFKDDFAKNAASVFGSGWTWLGLKDGKLGIFDTPNQDHPWMDIHEEKFSPILVIDVWEHAYYIKYQNKRPEYIDNFFNVINWDKVAERFAQ